MDTVTITGVDNYDQTGDVIVTVSATALNSSSVGVIAPEPVELAVVDDETTPKVTLTLSPLEVVEGEGRDGGRALLVASLDNRSSAETVVTVSVSPAEAAEVRGPSPLIIPPGQTASDDFVWIYPKDDTEFTESKKSVTVSGTATNPLGVSRPDDVTLTIVDDDGATLRRRQYFLHVYLGSRRKPNSSGSHVWQRDTHILAFACPRAMGCLSYRARPLNSSSLRRVQSLARLPLR